MGRSLALDESAHVASEDIVRDGGGVYISALQIG